HTEMTIGSVGEDLSRAARALEKQIQSNHIPGMTVLARRECFADVGLHREELVYSDWEFWIRMIARHPVGYIKEPLVRYRVHEHNTSLSANSMEQMKRALQVMESLQRHEVEHGGDLATPRTRSMVHLQCARYLFHLGNIDRAGVSLSATFEIYPEIKE